MSEAPSKKIKREKAIAEAMADAEIGEKIEIFPGVYATKRSIYDYQPDEGNVNKGSQRGQRLIEQSFREGGAGRSILVDADGQIIAGNHAQEGAINAGIETIIEIETEGNELVAVKRRDLDLDDPEDPRARRMALIDNESTAQSYNVAPEVLAGHLKKDPTLASGIWTDSELMQILQAGADTEEGEEDTLEEAGESLGIFKLETKINFLPSSAPYEIPELIPEMIPELPEAIELWPGDDLREETGPGPFLYIYGTSNTTIDWTNAFVGWYAYDDKLEPVWQKPDKYAARFLNAGVLGLVGLNFSVFDNQPDAVNIYQVYRTRWLGRFFQEASIPFVPDIEWSGERSREYAFAGVPHKPNCVSKNLQTFDPNNKEHVRNEREGIYEMLRVLEPQGVIFYGSKRGRAMVEEMNLDVPHVLLPTLMDRRRGKLKATKDRLEGRT